MKNVIGVRFKRPGKIYFFDPGEIQVNKKDFVIVETAMGEEYAEVVIENKEIDEEKLANPLKPVIRVATEEDKKHNEENEEKAKKAYDIAVKTIKKHNLDMNLVDTEYKFDNSKLLFYFTADGRIDFRDLVKELASIFKTRIELRQIGVRDQVKRIGGNGICGRELCCCSFLGNFETVSIKMAKEQNLSLTPSKISGSCGRLMCCLKYEHEVYEDKLSRLPKIGAIVKTDEGEGVVDSIETLKEKVSVKFKDKEGFYYKKYSANEIKIVKDVEENNNLDLDKESLKELKELERLEKMDKNEEQEDI